MRAGYGARTSSDLPKEKEKMKSTTTERKTAKTAAKKTGPKVQRLPMPPKKIKARYAKRALESLSKTPSNREVARRVEAWARALAAEKPETFGRWRILSAGSLQRLANRLRHSVAVCEAAGVTGKDLPSAFMLGFQPRPRGPYRRPPKPVLNGEAYVKNLIDIAKQKKSK
jgi:hypothetical protein